MKNRNLSIKIAWFIVPAVSTVISFGVSLLFLGVNPLVHIITAIGGLLAGVFWVVMMKIFQNKSLWSIMLRGGILGIVAGLNLFKFESELPKDDLFFLGSIIAAIAGVIIGLPCSIMFIPMFVEVEQQDEISEITSS